METSRTEIIEHIADAFDDGGADPTQLIAAANRNGAPIPVVDALRRLPDRRYRHVRDLWIEMPEIPVGG